MGIYAWKLVGAKNDVDPLSQVDVERGHGERLNVIAAVERDECHVVPRTR